MSMRFGAFGRVGGTLVASVVACSVWGTGGCTANKETELVPGVVSQIQVPRNLKTVRIDIQPQGQQSTCFIRSVDPTTGGVQLPRTLGIIPGGAAGTLVTVTVTGYTLAEDDPMAPAALQDCLTSPFNNGMYSDGVKILRRSRQPYVDGRILFVPMPLRYSCWEGQQCKDTETCVAGACVPADVDPNTLTEFNDNLISGSGDTCFSPKLCLAPMGEASVPAKVVDAASCTYTYPASMPLGPGVNVRVYYDHGESEVLDIDPAGVTPAMREGFTIPDATKPQVFQLAPNLCDMVKATSASPRRIVDVRMSTICQSKTLLQPICDGELNDPHTLLDGGSTTDGGCNLANELQPAPSALYLLLDNSLSIAPIYGPMGLTQVLSFSLNDPVFRTTSLAFKLLPHAAADCTIASPGPTTLSTPDVPFDLASKVQQQVATIVGDASKPLTTDPPLLLDAAFQPNGAYKALLDFRGAKAFNRMAVMLIINRPATDDCGGAHATAILEAQAAFGTANPADRVYTYVVMLGNSSGTQDPTEAQAIANAGGPAGAAQFFDARVDATQGAAAFNEVVSDLGSCLYEKPANIDTGAVVSYTDPLTQISTSVTFSAMCNEAAQNTADGWNIDAGRVRICGPSCTTLRKVLSTAANFALLMSLPAPNIPVTATQLCK
jgi:hypothetical protein